MGRWSGSSVTLRNNKIPELLPEQEAKQLWEGIQITNVREFAALERAAFRVWKRAGGSISDQTRIADIKQRFSPQMEAAYNAYVLSEDTQGRHDPQLEKQWGKFKLVFRRVGQAVQRSGGGVEAEVKQAAVAPTQRSIMPIRAAREAAGGNNSTMTEEQRLLQVRDLCFEHSKLGSCSYGAGCKWSHAGAAGALKHLVVDANGDCVQFKKFGNCRRMERGRCEFRHNPDSAQQPAPSQQQPATQNQNATAVMSAEQHKQIVSYAEAAGKDACDVTFEEVQAAIAGGFKAPVRQKNHFAVVSAALHSGPRSRRQRAQQVKSDPPGPDWDGYDGEELELDWAEQ